jgi:DNA recombination protein RmuC
LPEVLITAIAAFAVALVIGWLLWGRALAEARTQATALTTDRDSLREQISEEKQARARHATEVLALQNRVTELQSVESERNRLSTDLAALKAKLGERQTAFEAEIARTTKNFEALAGKALEAAQTQFLERAQARFTEHATTSEASLKQLLQPVSETLTRYETEIRKIETARTEAYSGLSETVKLVREGQESVRLEAAKLVNALRASPKARGRWGEQQLKNVLEMAGLAEHADFQTEVSVDVEDGRLRPDVIVRLPGGRQLVIDAKCSMNAFLDACDATDEVARGAHLAAHARALRVHADSLGRKAYWDQFAGSADYVIMFIPGEQFLSGALEADAGLWEYAFERKVLIATPTNLVAIARTVAVVWRQEQMSTDARKIGDLASELYKRLTTMGGHLEKLGGNLDKAVRSYNGFVGSLETNVLPQGRKLLELKVEPGAARIPELEPIETSVREARKDRDLTFDDAAE